MQLYPSGDSIYSPDVVFENSIGQIDYKTDRVYSGILQGDLNISNLVITNFFDF